jgi:hypothetical protein
MCHRVEVFIPCLRPCTILLLFFRGSYNLQTKERKHKEQGQEDGYNEQSKAASAGTRQKGRTNGHENGKGHHEASTTLPVRDKNCGGSTTLFSCRYSNIVGKECSIRQGLAVPDEKDVLGGNEETGRMSRGALVIHDGLFHAGNTDRRIEPEAKGLTEYI